MAGCEPAWRGDGGPEDKQRLKGSIVLLKSGKFAYLPVSLSSSVVKVFNTRDGEAGRVVKMKISSDGSESGTFHTAEEAERLIDKVWLGVCSVGTDRGSGADGLRVGGATASLRPSVLETLTLRDFDTVFDT